MEQNGLGSLLNDLASNPLQRVAFNVHCGDRLVRTEPGRQVQAVIIDHGQGLQLGKVERDGDGDLADAIVTNVEHYNLGELLATEFLHICQLVDVQVELLQCG